MNQHIINLLLQRETPTEEEKPLIDVLKLHLSLDNNKLREDFVCSLLGYTPSYAGAGHPDGYKPDGIEVDNKSGPDIVFPDGYETIYKKKDWVCLVSEFTKSGGELIYIAEVPVSSIFSTLEKSRKNLIEKNQRLSPKATFNEWINAEGVQIMYTNESIFPRTDKLGIIEKRFKQISNHSSTSSILTLLND